MALDLVQIRWQQIRLVEASQVLEAENVALRKEVEELKASKAAPAPIVVVQAPSPVAAVETGVDRDLVMRQCNHMTNLLMRTQSELMKLKLYAAKEIAGFLQQKIILSKAFENLQDAHRIREAEFEALEYSRDQLQLQLDEANRNMEDGKNNSSTEISKYKLKAKQARTELKESEEAREKLNELYRILNDKYNALHTAKTEIDANYNILNQEFQGMQALVDKARADGEAALAESFNNKLAMQEQYEKIVEELSYENEYLRNTCSEQEAQIERLTNSLIGNKSHFARYVEVKTENLTLQSKLQQVTKSAKRVGADLEVGIAAGGNGKDPAGLPARRSKSVFTNAGASAVNPAGSAGGWGSATPGLRMPSPRGDAPVEFSHRTQQSHSAGNAGAGVVRVPFRPSAPIDGQNNGVDGQPQSSPRFLGVGGLRQSSSSSVTSMRSVLVEPTLLPPPVSGIQPAPSDRPRGASFETETSTKGTKKSLRFEQSGVVGKTIV